MQSEDKLNQGHKVVPVLKQSESSFKLGLESVKNRREELSSFLDESSFTHSYLCGAVSSNNPHFHKD
jgi:hypothetical protein